MRTKYGPVRVDRYVVLYRYEELLWNNVLCCRRVSSRQSLKACQLTCLVFFSLLWLDQVSGVGGRGGGESFQLPQQPENDVSFLVVVL